MDIKKIQPKDIIALCTLGGIFFLKSRSCDGTMDGIMGLILGYYFVKRVDGMDKGV